MSIGKCIMKWVAKKGALGGIARSQYIKFKRTKNENHGLCESEICGYLFKSRFTTIKPTSKEHERLGRFLETNKTPENLRDVCQAIADIELDIHSHGTQHAILAVEVLYEELERLGYRKG